jgi:hypothetical protein
MATTVVDLLRELGTQRVMRAEALASALRVSRPTLSRLVAAAGDQVCRIGKTRATQYARTRTIEALGRSLPVFRVRESGDVVPDGHLRLLREQQTYWERPSGSVLFNGLPPALVDMAPQGYLGHGFAARYPELNLPPRLTDWSDDHRLIALARRGEDCVGDLIVGDESLQRYVAEQSNEVEIDDYVDLARRSSAEAAGSSAGGERPKFGAFSRGRHLLVKFAPRAETAAARRWQDLLWCEWKALDTIGAAGVAAAPASFRDVEGWRFLEVDRFDRIGVRGRRAVLSLGALNNEYFGGSNNWTAALPFLAEAPFFLSEADAARIKWLDVFGQLVANTDRHLGNLAFFVGDKGRLRLAPAYDMLPMFLAPRAEVVHPRDPQPAPPSGTTLDVWPDAAHWALRYWSDLQANLELDEGIRTFADRSIHAIQALASRVTPTTVAAVWRAKEDSVSTDQDGFVSASS